MVCSHSPTTAEQGGATAITAVYSDILQTHILTRLDGPTLASAASASSQLHALCTEEKLWREICGREWPSTTDPRVLSVISSFPSGHRSFFSDSFPTLDHHRPSSPPDPRRQSPPTSKLISAVDLYYGKKLVLSKAHETETVTGWFLCSPFRVDLLDPKETVPTPVKFDGGEGPEDTCLFNVRENLTLNWILIDPTRKRSANISSLRPVMVQRHWLTGEVQVRYATIVAVQQREAHSSEFVELGIEVTCGGKEGGELHVREVSFVVEDMDGKSLNGKDSLVILQEALENGKRRRGKKKGWEGKERFEEYLELKRVRGERRERRERRMDMLCMAIGVTIFMAFWALMLLR